MKFKLGDLIETEAYKTTYKVICISSSEYCTMDIEDGSLYVDNFSDLDDNYELVSEQPKSNPYASVLKELYSDTIINAFPDVPKVYAAPWDSGCAHTWKAYIGFNDSYNYCTKCDAKEKLS